MGRKRTMNRMEMRGDFEEGEEAETTDDESEEDEDGEEKPKKKKKPPPKPKAPPKPRTRAVKHVRMKIVWGVFNNSNNQVESFPFSQEKDARALAEKLSTDKKQTHFVQKVKKPLEEKAYH